MTKNKVAAGIFKLVESESEARYDYQSFLAEYGEFLDTTDKSVIKEIESDEFNHTLKLLAMARKYDGNIAASSDGAVEALTAIAEGIKDDD